MSVLCTALHVHPLHLCVCSGSRPELECSTTGYISLLVKYGNLLTHIIHQVFIRNPKCPPCMTACSDSWTSRAFTRECMTAQRAVTRSRPDESLLAQGMERSISSISTLTVTSAPVCNSTGCDTVYCYQMG